MFIRGRSGLTARENAHPSITFFPVLSTRLRRPMGRPKPLD